MGQNNQVFDVAKLPVPSHPEFEQSQYSSTSFPLVHERVLYDPTYELPSTMVRPKPTIIPPDDLHLSLDDNLDTSVSSSTYTSQGTSDSLSPTARATRVRFRPRVRITSGLHRHRPKGCNYQQDRSALANLSTESSLSSSPSSSISVPLRSPADDESIKPGWRPLGQRVSFLAGRTQRRFPSSREREKEKRERRRRKLGLPEFPTRELHGDPNEHTTLMGTAIRSAYVECEGVQVGDVHDSDGEDDMRLSREIDLVFGTWPGRLLNRRWWWWQLEPLVSCHCADDSETEE